MAEVNDPGYGHEGSVYIIAGKHTKGAPLTQHVHVPGSDIEKHTNTCTYDAFTYCEDEEKR